jgi:threonine dehydrogenase-like Zn-dependent dehydrogenase
MDKPTDSLDCLVIKYGWGACPECRAGFPQYCRGRGGVPKTKKKKDSRNG